MDVCRFFRPFLIVGSLGAAFTARAVSIDVASIGTAHQDYLLGGSLISTVTSQIGGLGTLTAGEGYFKDFSWGDIGFAGSGAGFLAWVNHLDYTFEPGGGTYRGAWYSNDDSSAMGPYSGYVGAGTIDIHVVATHFDSDGYDSDVTVHLTGEFTPAPVPEPASLCAFGLGAAALIRRRPVRK